jgi:hypothetical protein
MKIFIQLFLLFFAYHLLAQPTFDSKRDFEWIMGNGYLPNDTTRNIFLNFRTDTLTLSYKRHQGQNFYQTNASICDTSGNLLFYSNGCVLSDTNSQYIVGADTINRGPEWLNNCKDPYNAQIRTDGYVIVNGCWILPVAENKFKVFYVDIINVYAHTSGIRYATLLRNANTGELIGYNPDRYLLQKDLQPELRGVVRHANGRDWWMVNSDREDKTFYSTLIDSSEEVHSTDSIYFNHLTPNPFPGGCQGVFSPDGTKYCTIGPYHECRVMDFDRCTGKLLNALQIPLPIHIDSIFGVTGIAISPNSRFMYLMTSLNIWQYDLTAPDIVASKIRVAQHDGWYYQYYDAKPRIYFYQSQIGPDGKIYVFPPAARHGFSVIDQPDMEGVACNVIQHRYVFPEWCNVAQPPRFPNFRLGSIIGSPCDTLTVSTKLVEQTGRFILRPNPATTYSVADITVADYSEAMHLEVRALDGKLLGRYQVPPYAALQRIDTSLLPNGMYLVSLCSKGRVLKTEKLVVLREER